MYKQRHCYNARVSFTLKNACKLKEEDRAFSHNPREITNPPLSQTLSPHIATLKWRDIKIIKSFPGLISRVHSQGLIPTFHSYASFKFCTWSCFRSLFAPCQCFCLMLHVMFHIFNSKPYCSEVHSRSIIFYFLDWVIFK